MVIRSHYVTYNVEFNFWRGKKPGPETCRGVIKIWARAMTNYTDLIWCTYHGGGGKFTPHHPSMIGLIFTVRIHMIPIIFVFTYRYMFLKAYVFFQHDVEDHKVEAILHYEGTNDTEPTTSRQVCSRQKRCKVFLTIPTPILYGKNSYYSSIWFILFNLMPLILI